MNREKNCKRTSVFFTKNSCEELEQLMLLYGENKSRLINRLINIAYQNHKNEIKSKENKDEK